MHISKIELENIKSHSSSTYYFACGTTAITGENGAGKTTIIEAIAWAMFDLLEYKKEDFVKRGEKKGIVRITFESGLDEREYIVYRDTGAGYYVTDPRLEQRVAEKKEEVFRFLWQHLGLEPGTDLKSLFRQAIGVPQGTFTAIFLDGATERKIAFDRLLKVEEYRQAAEKLRDTSRYLENGIRNIREQIARAEGELTRSDRVTEEREAYQKQTAKLTDEIAVLERSIADRRDIVEKLDQAERIEIEVEKIGAEQKRILESIDGVAKARSEIASLKPKVAEQEKFEAEIGTLREQIAVAKAVEDQIKRLDERVARLRTSYQANAKQLKETEQRSEGAGNVASLQKSDADLIKNLAALQASLERDLKFQSEIKNGLCPILSQKCLNLEPGQTLDEFVSDQFSGLRSQISTLEVEQKEVGEQLRRSREVERFASALSGLKEREQELAAEGKRLTAERVDLEKQISGLAELDKRLSVKDSALRELRDPRGRIRFLENETSREAELREAHSKIELDLKRAETERDDLILELRRSGALDSAGVYDNAVHRAEKSLFHESEKTLAEKRATFNAAKRREVQLDAELGRFKEIRSTRKSDIKEKERLESVAAATTFIRDTLKEAAPRVARNYVYHVSVEANVLFREITGNAEQTLKWAEDYSIELEEGGYSRPFASFSGGEQMAAALSVRLALLKQLTDIRIAFFDEPTTNMDAERRENLAMQISRITNFDQLFVISHDETFDHYVDNVISIGN